MILRAISKLTSILAILLVIWQSNALAQKSGLEFQTFHNKSFFIDDIQTEVILINFWASWCGPCKEEFPSLLNLVKKSKGQVALIGVSVDKSEIDAKKFLQKMNYNTSKYPNSYFALDSNNRLSDLFDVKEIPQTFIIKKDHDKGYVILDKVNGSIKWQTKHIKPYL